MQSRPAPRSIDELNDLITAPDEGVLDAIRRSPGPTAVLGAGGKMGFHLAQMLSRASAQAGAKPGVTAISRFRTPSTARPFVEAGIRVIAADLNCESTLQTLPDFENVFYLAGVKFGTSADPDSLRRFNQEMPARVADRYARARIVALSTGCVYSFSTPESGGSTEESELDPPGDYARSCLAREAAFANAAERSALIRLNYSVDLRYGVLVDIAQRILAGEPVNTDTAFVNVIWQGDALSHICQALPLASGPPAIFNVTGAETLRVRDVATWFADRFDRDVRFEGEEQPTAWLSDASKAHRCFGHPRVSAEQLMEWVAAWLEQGGNTLGKPTHFEVRDGAY